MEGIDKFINDSANYDGGGYCSDIEWFDNNVGIGHGIDYAYCLGRGRDDSNGGWDSKGYGEGVSFGGHVSAKTNQVIGCCYVNKANLYGRNR